MIKHVIVINGIARVGEHREDVDLATVAAQIAATGRTVTSWRVIEDSDIPTDCEPFIRDAWEDNGKKITVNMQKAKAAFEDHLTKAKLAKARTLQLREDIGEDVTAERTALKVAPDVSAADTPVALKALWPEGLSL